MKLLWVLLVSALFGAEAPADEAERFKALRLDLAAKKNKTMTAHFKIVNGRYSFGGRPAPGGTVGAGSAITPGPVGVWGKGEGSVIAVLSAACDTRIPSTVQSQAGSLDVQPLYRNVWAFEAEIGA